MDANESKRTGTTIVALSCADGVVIGSEKRATVGTLIAHKVTKKIFKIDDHIALSTAGLVGDIQALARLLKAEAELYRLRCKVPMPLKGAATLMGNILNQTKYMPYYVQLILAGLDPEGKHVYALDAAGGAIEDKYTTGGSGSPYVFGVLEDHYVDGMSVDDGVDLTIRAISAAMKRDSASGNGIDIATITKDGYKAILQKEIEERKGRLNL
jgi:proteasome beta subunit